MIGSKVEPGYTDSPGPGSVISTHRWLVQVHVCVVSHFSTTSAVFQEYFNHDRKESEMILHLVEV